MSEDDIRKAADVAEKVVRLRNGGTLLASAIQETNRAHQPAIIYLHPYELESISRCSSTAVSKVG